MSLCCSKITNTTPVGQKERSSRQLLDLGCNARRFSLLRELFFRREKVICFAEHQVLDKELDLGMMLNYQASKLRHCHSLRLLELPAH